MGALTVIAFLIIGLHTCLGKDADGHQTVAVSDHPHNSHPWKEHSKPKWHNDHQDDRKKFKKSEETLQKNGGALDDKRTKWEKHDGAEKWRNEDRDQGGKQKLRKINNQAGGSDLDNYFYDSRERVGDDYQNKWHKKRDGNEKLHKNEGTSEEIKDEKRHKHHQKNELDENKSLHNQDREEKESDKESLINHKHGEGKEKKYHPEEGRREKSERENEDGKVARDGLHKKVIIQYLPASPTPPNPNDTLLMARYIVHSVDWAALGTTTTRGPGGPFSNVVSISDGPEDQGTGVPYFYITPMDLSTQDIMKDNRASVVVTLAQTSYCRSRTPSALDPEDPRCARLILSGKVKRIKAGSTEDEFARNALFSRHPVMKEWPQDHGFFTAKLKIGQIILLDQFGGPKHLDVKDYLHPKKD